MCQQGMRIRRKQRRQRCQIKIVECQGLFALGAQPAAEHAAGKQGSDYLDLIAIGIGKAHALRTSKDADNGGRLDAESGFFQHLPDDRLGGRLAGIDPAARQAPQPVIAPALQQDLIRSVADNRRHPRRQQEFVADFAANGF